MSNLVLTAKSIEDEIQKINNALVVIQQNQIKFALALPKKLEAGNILAGANITLNYQDPNLTISSTGGGSKLSLKVAGNLTKTTVGDEVTISNQQMMNDAANIDKKAEANKIKINTIDTQNIERDKKITANAGLAKAAKDLADSNKTNFDNLKTFANENRTKITNNKTQIDTNTSAIATNTAAIAKLNPTKGKMHTGTLNSNAWVTNQMKPYQVMVFIQAAEYYITKYNSPYVEIVLQRVTGNLVDETANSTVFIKIKLSDWRFHSLVRGDIITNHTDCELGVVGQIDQTSGIKKLIDTQIAVNMQYFNQKHPYRLIIDIANQYRTATGDGTRMKFGSGFINYQIPVGAPTPPSATETVNDAFY